MRITHFRHLLETRGPELSRWPKPWAEAARRLVASDATAARELEAASRLEGLMLRHMAHDAVDPEATTRVLRALRGPLPPQHSSWSTAWLPTALLTLDLSPSWPRVAALAAVAGLGFVIGLSDLSIGTRGTTAAATDTDLSMIVFEPDPLSGMRPL